MQKGTEKNEKRSGLIIGLLAALAVVMIGARLVSAFPESAPMFGGAEVEEAAEEVPEVIGSQACRKCHRENEISGNHLGSYEHPEAADGSACEFCHGPGSLHSKDEESARDNEMTNLAAMDRNTEYELCGECHFGMPAEGEPTKMDARFYKRTEHGKQLSCYSCHDFHGGAAKLVGKETNDLCISCHDDKQVVKHPFLSDTCTQCHESHGGIVRNMLKKSFYKEVCFQCHNAADENIKKAHGGMNITDVSCVKCHSLHSGTEKGLVKQYRHLPFEKGQCGVCHEKGEKGEFLEALKKNTKELCIGCHQGNYKDFVKDKKNIHPPVKDQFCAACHSPHTSDYRALVREETAFVCYKCHADIEDKAISSHRHPPVDKGKCLFCHNVKASNGEHLIDGGMTEKCRNCHDAQMEHMHPIGDELIVPDTKEEVNVICTSCHDVHGSNFVAIFKQDMTQQCRTCHKSH